MNKIPKTGWKQFRFEEGFRFLLPIGSLVKCKIKGKNRIFLVGNSTPTGFGACGCCEIPFSEIDFYEWHPFVSEDFSKILKEIDE